MAYDGARRALSIRNHATDLHPRLSEKARRGISEEHESQGSSMYKADGADDGELMARCDRSKSSCLPSSLG